MTAIDLLALGIMTGSMLIGAMRGAAREVFSLAAWVLAFLAARTLAPTLADLVPGTEIAALRYAAALVLVFVLVLLLAGLLGAMLAGLLRLAGLGTYDRVLGTVFGMVRGAVFLVLLTLLVGLTAVPRSEAWRDSLVHGPLQAAAQRLIPWLPDDLAPLIRFA